MSNAVSEWLIYSKSSSVPKVDIMTNLNYHRLRHFSSYKTCACWGVRVGCRDRRSSKLLCQLIHIQIDQLSSPSHLHGLLWIICSPWERRALNSNHFEICESIKTIFVTLKKTDIHWAVCPTRESQRDYTLILSNSNHPANSSFERIQQTQIIHLWVKGDKKRTQYIKIRK